LGLNDERGHSRFSAVLHGRMPPLSGGAVTRLGFAVGVEFFAGPEEATGDEVEIFRTLNRFVAVPDRCAKDSGFAAGVDPNHRVAVGRFVGCDAFSQGDAIGPDLNDFVKFIRVVLPARWKTFHDRMLRLEGDNFERARCLMTHGSDAEHFAPFITAGVAITVNRAMEGDSWDAIKMGFSDVLDPVDVRDLAGAFVVQDDIETFGPVGLVVDAEFVGAAFAVAFVDDGPGDVGASTDAFGEDFRLGGVIVTAAAGDEQSVDWLGGAKGNSKNQQPNSKRKTDWPQKGQKRRKGELEKANC